MSAKILLVEDDPNFGNVLKNFLELNDYTVQLVRDGQAGLEAFSKGGMDLIILDVMMPKMDGFTLARQIREMDKKTPVFFLTAKGMKEDMLAGYRSGADDFLTKPFDTDVLLYKIKTVLRRSMGLADLEDRDHFRIGMYTFDYKLRKVIEPEETVQLSPKEAELLKLLCVHENDLLPRQKALKLIWGEDNYFNGRSMDVFITKLRKYLKKDPNVEIVSLHGKGVRLLVNKG
ncbi:MAG: response regulator transcription factor [Bacteroidia bacterium]|nr:response regulator transcription factor [Bacteroidia bacterium]